MLPREAATTVSARALCRRFGKRLAVEGVTIELRRGEVLGLLGPNGAGKTTTLQMLTGNLAPSAGEIRICGIDLLAEPTAAKAHIGYLPEVPPLYRELTVDEYLGFAARLHRVPRARRREAVAEAKRRCGLAEVGRRLIGALSRGYQQRVGVAQAIVHAPDVVILDEPSAGLDPNQMREMRALVRELAAAHSVILSSHILPEVEAACDRVQILHHGRVVYSDTIAALRRFRSAASVLVGLRWPPPREELAALPGVVAVESLEPTLFRLHLAALGDAPQALVEAAAARGWGLYRLAPEQASLEDVFAHLTRSEEEP